MIVETDSAICLCSGEKVMIISLVLLMCSSRLRFHYKVLQSCDGVAREAHTGHDCILHIHLLCLDMLVYSTILYIVILQIDILPSKCNNFNNDDAMSW